MICIPFIEIGRTMSAINDYYAHAKIVFDQLCWVNEPTRNRRRQAIDALRDTWIGLNTSEPMDFSYRKKYADNLNSYISDSLDTPIQQTALLPDHCPECLIYQETDLPARFKEKDYCPFYNAAIITDKELDATFSSKATEIKIAFAENLELFKLSREADLLPTDIRYLQQFCDSFCFHNHTQDRVYIYQNAFDALVDYGTHILRQEPIWLDEECDVEYQIAGTVPQDFDILSDTSMSTPLVKHILSCAADKNMKLVL